MIVSRMIYRLYFLMSSLGFFLMVLHISAFSVHCLSSTFSTISHRFVIMACVDDDLLDFSGLLIALATLDAHCSIVSVMVSLMVPMSSSTYVVSIWFLNSSWNPMLIDHICVASTFCYQCVPFNHI